MYLGDDAILVESRAARDRQMAQVNDDQARDVLNQAKAIIFEAWRDKGIARTEQVAEFYDVPDDTVQTAIKSHRNELELDGLKVFRGKDLKEVVSVFDTSPSIPSLTVWTPRAALRLAMFLRDSAVARQVRTLLIDIAVRSVEENQSQRNLELEVELQRLRNDYQRTGWEIVQATSPRMLAFIRGELPLIRTEIQYVDHQTKKPIGTTTRYRILAQLVEDVGLRRNSNGDRELVKDILKRWLGMDFETGEGLGKGFTAVTPVVIPENRYEECLEVVAIHLYGANALAEWQYSDQLLPDYLKERGLLASGEEAIDDLE